MGITVTDNKKEKKISLSFTEDDYRRVAAAMVAAIQERTLAGLSADGEKRFKPYTKEYAAWKGQTHVDLKLIGTMLNSLIVKRTRTGFRITLPDSEMKKALGNEVNGRAFMGITKSTIEAMELVIAEIVDEKLGLTPLRSRSTSRRTIK